MFNTAIEILKKIESLGDYNAYIVGGAVRDIILNNEPKDIDISTNCPMEILEDNFKCYDIGQSRDFGIVTTSVNNFSFEIAQFRTESCYDGRCPDEVNFITSFKEDANRRDFTINAMAMDKNRNIIDYFNGSHDIEQGMIKAVGVSTERFQEDGLRIMRAIRFAARYGFNIEDTTWNAIKNNVHMLSKISKERIKDEMFKMASENGKTFCYAIELMINCGIMEFLFPEFTNLSGLPHGPYHPEGCPAEHSLEALKKNNIKNPLINIAILFHDIGKGPCFKIRDGYKVTFYGHENVGAFMFKEIAKTYKFSNSETESIFFAIINHMKFHNIIKMKPSKVDTLISDPNFDILQQVSYCDDSCRLHMFNEEKWNETIKYIEQLKNQKETQKEIRNTIRGQRVIELTDCSPGPIIGEVLRAVTKKTVDNNINNSEEIDKLIVKEFNKRNI